MKHHINSPGLPKGRRLIYAAALSGVILLGALLNSSIKGTPPPTNPVSISERLEFKSSIGKSNAVGASRIVQHSTAR